jgi:hypothetical protein
MIANQAIMRDVSLGHEEAIIANLCQSTSAGSSAMYGDEFANARAAADYRFRVLARKL